MMMVVVQCRWRNAQLSSSSFLPPLSSSSSVEPMFQSGPPLSLSKRRFERNFSRASPSFFPPPRVQRKIERFFEISEHTSGRSLDSEGEKSFLLCDSEFPRIFLLRGIFFFSDNRFAILGITATVFFFFFKAEERF